MLTVHDWASLSRVLKLPIDSRLKRLLIGRRDQFADCQELAEVGRFIIVQPGDGMAEFERELGFSVFQNPVDGKRFGDLDFSPGWDWIANHGHCFEIVFIFDDSGFAHVVFVQDSPMQNRVLRALCLTYAE